MFQRRLKVGYFILEGLNAFAVTYYAYSIFFYMEKVYGFGKVENLTLSAYHGFLYMFAAWYGGRYSQTRGYFSALRLGFSIMGLSLLVGFLTRNLFGQLAVFTIWTFGMCFTWPTLEALVSEKEDRHGLQKMLGVYNLVWAGLGGISYLVSGALLETLGLNSFFLLPASIHVLQLVLLIILQKKAARSTHEPNPVDHTPGGEEPEHAHLPLKFPATTFLKMSYIANPFAYVAVNTVVPLIPSLATKLGLTTSWATVFCSIWFLARFVAFFILWKWRGWHYRFGWLVLSYLGLMAGFVLMLTVRSLPVLFVVQIGLGFCLGLIYYSSLFYSMDVGETKGEHGGFHEAAIGVGIFMGPAMGAGSLYFLPQFAHSGMFGVLALLAVGLGGILFLRYFPGNKRGN